MTQEISHNVQQAAHGTEEVTQNMVGISRTVADTGAGSNQVLTAAGALGTQATLLRSDVARAVGRRCRACFPAMATECRTIRSILKVCERNAA